MYLKVLSITRVYFCYYYDEPFVIVVLKSVCVCMYVRDMCFETVVIYFLLKK